MKEELIKELEESGVKFNKNEIVFITKDKSGMLVWLETGNGLAGLKHIVERHREDFEKAFGINEESIPIFLKNTITNGEIVSTRERIIANRRSFEKVYLYEDTKLVMTGIGGNGFIVSAYPSERRD